MFLSMTLGSFFSLKDGQVQGLQACGAAQQPIYSKCPFPLHYMSFKQNYLEHYVLKRFC